jgi:hypothetical protein
VGKPNAKPRTDATPDRVIRKRIREARRRGEQNILVQQLDFYVAFSPDFDLFSARVAHALRRHLFYRTDGGRFARGLVRQPESRLREVHKYFADLPTRENHRAALVTRLIRRKGPKPGDRWVLQIEFAVPVHDHTFEDSGSDVDTNRFKEMEKHFFDRARNIITNSNDIPKKRKRILAYLDLADGLDWPHFLELWHYTPAAVRAFSDASEEEREKMVAAGGGKFPLDGKLPGQRSKELKWRTKPFEYIFQKYGDDQTLSDADLKSALVSMDDAISESIHIRNSDIAGEQWEEETRERRWQEFKKHQRSLATTHPGHLYYLWNKGTEDDRGVGY